MGGDDRNSVKGAIEFYCLMLVFMLLCVFGIGSVDLIHQISKVHLFKDYTVNIIDNHHTYDLNVANEIKKSDLCSQCRYEVSKADGRYRIDVSYDLVFKPLNLQLPLYLKTYSNMVF